MVYVFVYVLFFLFFISGNCHQQHRFARLEWFFFLLILHPIVGKARRFFPLGKF